MPAPDALGARAAADPGGADSACALERADWRCSERRYVGPSSCGDERGALALIEIWRRTS